MNPPLKHPHRRPTVSDRAFPRRQFQPTELPPPAWWSWSWRALCSIRTPLGGAAATDAASSCRLAPFILAVGSQRVGRWYGGWGLGPYSFSSFCFLLFLFFFWEAGDLYLIIFFFPFFFKVHTYSSLPPFNKKADFQVPFFCYIRCIMIYITNCKPMIH